MHSAVNAAVRGPTAGFEQVPHLGGLQNGLAELMLTSIVATSVVLVTQTMAQWLVVPAFTSSAAAVQNCQLLVKLTQSLT